MRSPSTCIRIGRPIRHTHFSYALPGALLAERRRVRGPDPDPPRERRCVLRARLFHADGDVSRARYGICICRMGARDTGMHFPYGRAHATHALPVLAPIRHMHIPYAPQVPDRDPGALAEAMGRRARAGEANAIWLSPYGRAHSTCAFPVWARAGDGDVRARGRLRVGRDAVGCRHEPGVRRAPMRVWLSRMGTVACECLRAT